MPDRTGADGHGIRYAFPGILLCLSEGSVPAVYIKRALRKRTAAPGYCGGYAGRTAGGEPFRFLQEAAGSPPGTAGEKGTVHSFFESAGVCRIYFLPQLRLRGEMSPL